MIGVSVVICTYNRAEMLSATLNSWRSLFDTEQGVELIIVDNNSTDHTAQVVESFRPNCSARLRYILESRVGLSHARNRGIQEAAGDIIVFVDDDVYFDKNWLKELRKAFETEPDIACVGGKSLPIFESAVPDWITEDMYSFFGSTRSGEHDRMMIFPEHPFGLNMSFKKSVFEKVGGFNPRLGRAKGCLLSNEELDMFQRVNDAGLKVYYAANALLYHRIPSERTDKEWIVERTYWQGVSDVVYWQIANPKNRLYLLLKALWISKAVVYYHLKICLAKLLPKTKIPSLKRKLAVYRLMGIIRQNIVEAFSYKKC